MMPLHERRNDETRGRNLVAARLIDAGSVIFVEKPLLCLQSVGNSHAGALTCRCCRCFVGGPDLALAVASGRVSREEAIEYWETEIRDSSSALVKQGNAGSAGEDDTYAIVPCRNNCGELYCSAKCEEDMWSVGGHCLLCTGLIAESEEGGAGSHHNAKANDEEEEEDTTDRLHPLLQFKIHAVQSNEILLMVADLIASVISTLCRRMDLEEEQDNQGAGNISPLPTLDEMMAPYLDFTLVPWWEVATAPLLSSPMGFAEAAELDSALRRICTESSALLKEAIVSCAGASTSHNFCRAMVEIEEKCDVFSPIFFAKIIGSFEQNALGIRARHPLCRDIFNKELRVRCHEDLIRCIEAAGMIGDDAEEEEDDDDEEEEQGNKSNIRENEGNNIGVARGGEETVEEESEEYSVDEIAGFLAGLNIDEENADLDKEKPNNEEDMIEEDTGDDLDALFIPLDGTAMYYTTCKMNHSCSPNVVARYRYSSSATAGGQWGSAHPLAVECVALRDINEGEELAISYIQSDDPLDKRTEALNNYGFACNCSKCEAEKRENGGEEIVTIDAPECEEMPDPFGGDDEEEDSDDPFGSDSDDDEDDAVKTTEGGEALLEQRVLSLNNAAGSSTLGRLPLFILAKSSSYVINTGSDVLDDISDTKKGVCDKDILEYIESIDMCLRKVVKMLQSRDFVGCFSSALKGEALGLSLLYQNGSWPDASLRAAYWCLALSAAIANADAGNFNSALAILDKVIIFGLPKECVKQMMEYVQYHSLINSRIKVYLRFGRVNAYQSEDVNLMKDALSRPIEYPLKSVLGVSRNDFDCKYVLESHPLVIRGFAASWPAIEKWCDMDFWANAHGHRLVPIELGDMQRGGMKEQIMRLDNFTSSYLKPSSEKACWSLEMATSDSDKDKSQVAYLAQHQVFEQIPELLDDIMPSPSLCGEAGLTHVNAWIGTGGTRTPLHFDSYDNLFVQVVGSKYVRIYGNSETDKLYVIRKNDAKSSYGAQGNMSAIDCELEDHGAHPASRNAKYTEVIMMPGDCLFIPARAWHYVRSLSTSVSVNFWF